MTTQDTTEEPTADDFVAKGWQDHAKDAEGVFARLPAGIAMATARRHGAALAALVVHVGGEHLGRWDESVALIETIRAKDEYHEDAVESRAIARSAAVLHHCAGRPVEMERELKAARDPKTSPTSDRARVLAVAAAAFLTQRRTAEARADLEAALALVGDNTRRDDPVARALAVSCNNMASDMESLPSRSEDQAKFMVFCAEQALRWWKLAGGPDEEGRAEYRLASSLLVAGRAAEALAPAGRSLAVFTAAREPQGDDNGPRVGERAPADPSDVLFGHEIRCRVRHALGDRDGARADRAAAYAILANIGDAEFQTFCAGELAKLPE